MFCKKKKNVNVVRLQGIISTQGRNNLSLESVKSNIDRAFKDKKSVAVAFLINSPGGSAVQSEIIGNYILEKSTESNIPTISFIEDVAASGGYWLALSSENVYALSKSSIVGSLGVLYASFGLNEFIKKHGIERRVHTAGKNKVSLDIFQSEKEEDIVRLKNMLAEVHSNFKEWVLKRRYNKLKISEEELFTGEYWVASQGLEKGLIDDIVTSLEGKLKTLFGDKIKINYLQKKKSLIANLFSIKNNLIEETLSELKASTFWNKYGL